MAEEKGKGFTVVDKRVSAEQESAEQEKGVQQEEAPKTGSDGSSAEAKESASSGAARPADRQAGEGDKTAAEKESGAAGSSAEASGAAAGAEIPVSFPTFLLSLHTSALVHLGLIPEPGSEKPRVSLPLARHNIDLLEILKEKTKGNLTEEETKLLDNILYELRMAYIQVSQAEGKKEA